MSRTAGSEHVELPILMYEDEAKKLEVGRRRSERAKHAAIRLDRARWALLAVLGAVAFGLGFVGYYRQFRFEPHHRQLSDALYYTIKLFGFSVELPASGRLAWQLEIARWLAPVVAGFTALTALATVFRDRIRQSLLSLSWRDHYVVCGLGEKGKAFVRALRAEGKKVAVIERDGGCANAAFARELGAIVVIGDSRERAVLEIVGAPRAACVVAVCGDDDVNAEIAIRVDDLPFGRRRRPLRCFVDMGDPDLALMLGAHQRRSEDARAEITFGNVIEAGVRELLREYPPDASTSDVHVLVVGSGEFAGRVVAHLARRWVSDAPPRATVTVIDEDADRLVDAARSRSSMEIPFELRSCAISAHAIGRSTSDLADARPVTIVYVCTGDDASGLAATLALRAGVITPEVPVVVSMAVSTGLARLLNDSTDRDRIGVTIPFAMLERTCDLEALEADPIEILAQSQHARYVQARVAKGDTIATNPSLRPWDALSEPLRESNRDSARSIFAKIEKVGCMRVPIHSWEIYGFAFTDDEVEQLSRDEHDRFVRERLAQGWSYAPGPKDETRRTSPTLVPWEQLPEEEREKDRDAVRHIPRQLADLGWQIMRLRSTSTA